MREVQEWTVLDQPTACDHKYVKIKPFPGPQVKTRSLTKKREEKVLCRFKDDEWFASTGIEKATSGELDDVIDAL